MPIKTEAVGQVVTARISGELDHHTAKQMREAIDNAIKINMPTLVIIDFSEISFMDSSGVGLVMGRYRELSRTGAELCLTGMSDAVYRMMKLAGIEKIAKLEKGSKKNENSK